MTAAEGSKRIIRDCLLQAWQERKDQEQQVSLETAMAWQALQGWRTLPQIVKGIEIPPGSLYSYLEKYLPISVGHLKNPRAYPE